jgi:hypothetical protein
VEIQKEKEEMCENTNDTMKAKTTGVFNWAHRGAIALRLEWARSREQGVALTY